MKTSITVGVVFLIGLAAGVAALLLLGGGEAPKSNATAEAADDAVTGKAPEAAKYTWQFERTKRHLVGEKVVGTYIFNAKLKAEYEFQVGAARVRRGGNELHQVYVRVEYLHVDGLNKPYPTYDFYMLSSDAASLIHFIASMKGKQKTKGDVIDYASIQWQATTRTDLGAELSNGHVKYRYDGKMDYSGSGNTAFQLAGDKLPELFAEGLKDLDKLKATPWSPTP